MIEPVLKVEGLTGPAGWPALFDVNMTLPRGGTGVVLGPIHSGKTLLMRHLLGLEVAERGSITIDGECFDASCASERTLRRVRTRTGVVFSGAALMTRLTVLENVELPLLEHTNASAAEARELAHSLLAEVGIAPAEDMTPDQLDRGAQRRAALARAVALRPPLILLDEPTTGLDRHSAVEVDRSLTKLREAFGFAVVVFSHESRYAFGMVDTIFVMDAGSIALSGDRESVQKSDHPVVQRLISRQVRT